MHRLHPATAKHRPGPLTAACSALLAALVLLLSLAAGSPLFHAWLHHSPPAAECPAHARGNSGRAHDAPASGAPDGYHACAVTLFAQGVHLNAALAAPEPGTDVLYEAAPIAPREHRPATPPHLRPHSHAPPV